MSFMMFGYFPKYGGWPMIVIETCQRFYEKYNRYPNFIRMKEKTMDALFDENEKAALDPYSEEHAVRDTNGKLLMFFQDWILYFFLSTKKQKKELPCITKQK